MADVARPEGPGRIGEELHVPLCLGGHILFHRWYLEAPRFLGRQGLDLCNC